MIEDAFATFGKPAFQHAVFYSFDTALRFELAHGSSRTQRFRNALHRARDITRYLFDELDQVTVCLANYSGPDRQRSLLSRYSLFRDLRECEIEITRPYSCYSEEMKRDDESILRRYLAFRMPRSQLDELLWGCLGRELGIQPTFSADTYIYDCGLGLLCHPYDDRGMDVTGPNLRRLRETRKQYQTWTLA